MKVKNIMFFGFAAAILSAGAASAAVAPNPSEKHIVTSKYYVDSLVSDVEESIPDIDDLNAANKDLNNLTATGKANVSAQGTYDSSTNYTAGTVGAAIKGKADSATTLAGYGITDAYTTTEVDTAIQGSANTATYDSSTSYTAGTVGATIKELEGTAGTALQPSDITTGTDPNTIAVDGTNVLVQGYPVDTNSTCDSTHPCALVDFNGSKKWVEMAQPE